MRASLIIAASAAAAVTPPAAANDGAANAVYERMQASSTADDPTSLLETVYAPNATYLPGHRELGIDGREAVLKNMAQSQQHLRKAGGRVDLKFRVVDRKRFGDIYVDSGYMRMAVKPAQGATEQIRYSKFVTVLARQPGGDWAFVADSESEAPLERFEKALRTEGVKFDL